MHAHSIQNTPLLCYTCCYRAFIFIKMETYKWHTIEPHSNNKETMDDYLENHLPGDFEVIFEDGTYAEIKNKNTGSIWSVNASGDGDFTHHKVEFDMKLTKEQRLEVYNEMLEQIKPSIGLCCTALYAALAVLPPVFVINYDGPIVNLLPEFTAQIPKGCDILSWPSNDTESKIKAVKGMIELCNNSLF